MITKVDYLELLSYVIRELRETYSFDYVPLEKDEDLSFSVVEDLDHSLRSDKLKLEILVKRLVEVRSALRFFEELKFVESDDKYLELQLF